MELEKGKRYHGRRDELKTYLNNEIEFYIQKRAPKFIGKLMEFSKRWFDSLGIETIDDQPQYTGRHMCELATLALAHGLTIATRDHNVDIFRVGFMVKRDPKTNKNLKYNQNHSIIEIMDKNDTGLVVDPTYPQFNMDYLGKVVSFPFSNVADFESYYPGSNDKLSEQPFPTKNEIYEQMLLDSVCRPLTHQQIKNLINDYRSMVSVMAGRKYNTTHLPNNEWSNYPNIKKLIDPKWQLHPEKILHPNSNLEHLYKTSAQATTDRFEPSVIQEWKKDRMMVLDVSCGHNILQRKVITTPVGHIPNAYGIDPLLNFFPGLPDRTIPGYAEDMPFLDDIFDLTFSMRGVGWYADTAIYAKNAVREMIRVTRPGGLVSIFIGGSGGLGSTKEIGWEENRRRILSAIDNLKLTDLGKKIKVVSDFTDTISKQINIRL